MIQKLLNRWNTFWYLPVQPHSLGVCRFLFFGWLFLWFREVDFTLLAFYPQEFWSPIKLLQLPWLRSQPTSELIAPLQFFWKISLFFACLGFFTRTSCLAALFLGTYLLALTHSFHKINHSDAGLLFAIGILALSRSGDSFSVDALRKTRSVFGRSDESAEYRWPQQMIRVLVVIIFFAAGYSKLHTGGLEWFTKGFATLLVRNQLVYDPALSIGIWIASHQTLATMIAIGSVVIELAAPIALFSRVAHAIVIPSLFLMQVGIKLIMTDNFTQFMALYLFWLPWPFLANVALRHRSNAIEDRTHHADQLHQSIHI